MPGSCFLLPLVTSAGRSSWMVIVCFLSLSEMLLLLLLPQLVLMPLFPQYCANRVPFSLYTESCGPVVWAVPEDVKMPGLGSCRDPGKACPLNEWSKLQLDWLVNRGAVICVVLQFMVLCFSACLSHTEGLGAGDGSVVQSAGCSPKGPGFGS